MQVQCTEQDRYLDSEIIKELCTPALALLSLVATVKALKLQPFFGRCLEAIQPIIATLESLASK